MLCDGEDDLKVTQNRIKEFISDALVKQDFANRLLFYWVGKSFLRFSYFIAIFVFKMWGWGAGGSRPPN